MGHLIPRKGHATRDDQFGDVRQPIAHLHERHLPSQIRECNPEHGDLLELTQRFDLPLGIVRRQPFRSRVEFAHEAVPRR